MAKPIPQLIKLRGRLLSVVLTERRGRLAGTRIMRVESAKWAKRAGQVITISVRAFGGAERPNDGYNGKRLMLERDEFAGQRAGIVTNGSQLVPIDRYVDEFCFDAGQGLPRQPPQHARRRRSPITPACGPEK